MNADYLNFEFSGDPIGGETGNVPSTLAGNYLCRRYLVRPIVADLVASLAGLDSNRELA
jgi:hypothetical protein